MGFKVLLTRDGVKSSLSLFYYLVSTLLGVLEYFNSGAVTLSCFTFSVNIRLFFLSILHVLQSLDLGIQVGLK